MLTSFSILGDMVAQVGGDRVAVTSIVGPNADTHVYEPKPQDAAALGGAQAFFVNGLGFEGWLDRLVEATDFKGAVVTASDAVKTHTFDEDGTVATDPHAWQDPRNGIIYAKNIMRALAGIDPEHAEAYGQRLRRYQAQLEGLGVTLP